MYPAADVAQPNPNPGSPARFQGAAEFKKTFLAHPHPGIRNRYDDLIPLFPDLQKDFSALLLL